MIVKDDPATAEIIPPSRRLIGNGGQRIAPLLLINSDKSMCLYEKNGQNPRYKPNKKNKGVTPISKYDELEGIIFKCGTCLECRRERGNSWRIRLREEMKEHEKSMFVTLTFSDESIASLIEACDGVDEANTVAKKAIRRMLERIRKQTGRSVKHWFIVEIGGSSTERIHIHGIIFGEHWTNEKLQRYWTYGRSDVGYECSEKTINYIVKYITKIDEVHKDFISIVMTSPGIGRAYVEKYRKTHVFREENTVTKYRTPTGAMVELPCYYKRKLWTDEEREELRMYARLSDIRWVGKTQYIVETYEDAMIFYAAKTAYVEEMERLGFPTPMVRKKRRYKTINNNYAMRTKSL